MARELRYDQDQLLTLDIQDGLVPVSATLVVRSPSGTVLQSPTATVASLATTVAADSDELTLQLASVAGLEVGQFIVVTMGSTRHVRRVTGIDGTAVSLLVALPAIPAVGAAVATARLSGTVAALGVAKLGANYSAEWTWTESATKTGSLRETVDVVRFPFSSPVTANDVAEVLAYSHNDSQPEGWCRVVAERAFERLAQGLRARGDRPHLYIDSSLFRNAGLSAVRWCLAESGYAPVGSTADEHTRTMRLQFQDELKTVVQSLAPYDANDDGAVAGDAEERRSMWTFRTSR